MRETWSDVRRASVHIGTATSPPPRYLLALLLGLYLAAGPGWALATPVDSGPVASLTTPTPSDNGSTVARLSLWVPPGRVAEASTSYEAQLAPVLTAHGLAGQAQAGQSSPGIASWVFELSDPAAVALKRKELGSDPSWQRLMAELGPKLGGAPGQPLRWEFAVSSAPVGPGRTTQVGYGTGIWTKLGVPQGLPSVDVRAIAQDRDGNLWFGTRAGVSRFDGTRFTTWTTKDGLSDNEVRAVLPDGAGGVWLATSGGLDYFDGKSIVDVGAKDGLAGKRVLCLAQARDGVVWAGLDDGAVRYDRGSAKRFAAKDGLVGAVWAIAEDRDGTLWFGTSSGVSHFVGQSFQSLAKSDGLAGTPVISILQDASGAYWFGTDSEGVSRYDGHTFTNYTQGNGLPNSHVPTIAQDPDGSIWLGTYGGLSRYKEGQFQTYTTADGLSSDRVLSSFRDRDGYLWFGTLGGGASRYSDEWLSSLSLQHGLPSPEVWTLLADRDGSVWLGTPEGLGHFDGKQMTTYTTADGLAGNVINAAFADSRGNLWFGTGDGGVTRYDGRRFTSFAEPDGLASNWVQSIAEDGEGNIWFGTGDSGASRYDGRSFRNFTTADGLPSNSVGSIVQDRDGSVWLATSRGLARFDGRRFVTFTTRDGLPSDQVTALALARDGALWVGTAFGASRYDGRSLRTFTRADGLAGDAVEAIGQDGRGRIWLATRGAGVSLYDGQVFTSIATADGLPSDTVTALAFDRDGNAWLGSTAGATSLRQTPHPPPEVSVESVEADQHYDHPSNLALPSTAGLVSFAFRGASSHTRTEALVYRYRLAGYDADWRTTRDPQVEYQNLPIGDYTFEVQAVDHDLVYSPRAEAVHLQVRPPYVLLALAALAAALLVVAGALGWRLLRRGRLLQAAQERQRVLAASEARFREMFEGNRAVMLLVDPEADSVVDANPAAVAFYGYPREGLVGMPLGQIADTLDSHRSEGESPLVGEHRLAGGESRLVEVHLSPLERDGRRLLLAIVHDVTERRRAEEERTRLSEEAARRAAELRSVLDHMVDAVFVVGIDGRIALTNSAAAKLFGPVHSADSGSLLDDFPNRVRLRHPDGSPVRAEEMATSRALAGETVVELDQVAHDDKTGQDRLVRLSASPIRDGRGRVVAAVAVARDVTELTELDRLKDEFVVVAAHELKTPVTAVKGYAQLLARSVSANGSATRAEANGEHALRQRRILQGIDRGVDRVDGIVRKLLDVSQLQLGQLRLTTEPVDLFELGLEVVDRLAASSPKHQVRLQGLGPVVVQGDRSRLRDVLEALVDNAIKYSPEGGDVDVSIALRDGEALVLVHDQGVGIPKDRQARIFECFYRAHTRTPYDYGGMGAGLYIVREIVRHHGGSVWFESEPGKGSTFFLALPASSAGATAG